MEHIISSYLCIIWPTAANLHTLPPTLPPYLRLPLLQRRVRSGFSFHRGREEAVYCDRLRRHTSKHYGSVHTFRRSTSPVRLVGVVGEFPDTCVATELMHGLRRKIPLRFPLLCSLLPSLCST